MWEVSVLYYLYNFLLFIQVYGVKYQDTICLNQKYIFLNSIFEMRKKRSTLMNTCIRKRINRES